MSVGMLVYSFTVRPFAEPGLNAQECINETITLITAYMMVLFTNLVPNTARIGGMNVKTAIGWFMIGVIGLAIIINLFLIIKTIVNEFKEKARTRKIQSMMLLKFEHLNKKQRAEQQAKRLEEQNQRIIMLQILQQQIKTGVIQGDSDFSGQEEDKKEIVDDYVLPRRPRRVKTAANVENDYDLILPRKRMLKQQGEQLIHLSEEVDEYVISKPRREFRQRQKSEVEQLLQQQSSFTDRHSDQTAPVSEVPHHVIKKLEPRAYKERIKPMEDKFVPIRAIPMLQNDELSIGSGNAIAPREIPPVHTIVQARKRFESDEDIRNQQMKNLTNSEEEKMNLAIQRRREKSSTAHTRVPSTYTNYASSAQIMMQPTPSAAPMQTYKTSEKQQQHIEDRNN